jgi:outer membrane protein TolC
MFVMSSSQHPILEIRKAVWVFALVIACVCAVLIPPVSASAGSGDSALPAACKLTLEQSVDIALKNNPMVFVASESVTKAAAQIDEAAVPGRPTLHIETQYERMNRPPTVVIGDYPPITLGGVYCRTADLIFLQNLDAFGLVRTGLKAAKYNKLSSTHGYSQQVNDTTLDVKTAFYDVLRARASVKVVQETIDQLNAHLADAEKSYKAGAIAKFDVLRAQTELANVQQSLIAAQNGAELASAAFNNVLGRPLDMPVELVDAGELKPAEPELTQCVDVACRARPEILRAETQVQYTDAVAQAARLESKPKFWVKWDYNRNLDANSFDTLASSWKAVVGGTISLYDGGATRAATKKAESDARTARSMMEQAMQAVKLDAQQSYLSLQESKERINAATQALVEAKESKRLADLRYKGGLSTQVEVLDAQAALTLAQTNYVTAQYDCQVALAKLEHAVGGHDQMGKIAVSR